MTKNDIFKLFLRKFEDEYESFYVVNENTKPYSFYIRALNSLQNYIYFHHVKLHDLYDELFLVNSITIWCVENLDLNFGG